MGAEWWVGAYGADMDGSASGISLMRAREDGSLGPPTLVAHVQSPTFLAQRGDHLYAAAEGSATVHSFHHVGDRLEHDGSCSSGGTWPCQLEFLDDAIVVANYFDGPLGVVSLSASGTVQSLVQVVPGTGSGPHPEQNGPHAHASIRLDATTLASLDLGADRIHLHDVVGITIARAASISLPPGTGPRDIVRHPSGLYFVLGEHGCTLHTFDWVGGTLEPVSSIALPGSQTADQAAAIGFGHDGQYAYVGLRGSNLISVVAVSSDGRALEGVAAVSTAGDWPRHLVVDGTVVHVANQRSNTIASFNLAPTGLPELIATPTAVASPTYLAKAP